MSGAAVIAIVLFVFFALGVTVGIIVVAALSARRAHRTARRIGPGAPLPGRWPYLPETDPDDDGPDGPAWRQARGGD
jgi:hypothetical protein